MTAPVAPFSAKCSRSATSRARLAADISRADRTRRTPSRRDGSMVSSEATSSSESFSPGRIPVKTIGISRSGMKPDSRIRFRAMSTTRISSPMSST